MVEVGMAGAMALVGVGGLLGGVMVWSIGVARQLTHDRKRWQRYSAMVEAREEENEEEPGADWEWSAVDKGFMREIGVTW